jgi:hypothetical protein
MTFKGLFDKYYGKEILKTVIASTIVAIAGVAYKTFIVSHTNLNGHWRVALKIKNSTYKPYLNMGCEYNFNIIQNDDIISGSAEKYDEISADGKVFTYNSKQRLHSKFDGHIENGHFGNADITLNMDEWNIYNVKSISTFELKVINKDSLAGKFISSAAEADGGVFMKRIE